MDFAYGNTDFLKQINETSVKMTAWADMAHLFAEPHQNYK